MSPLEKVRVFASSHSFALTHTNAKAMKEKLQPKVRKSLKLHSALLLLANQLLQATVSSKSLMLQAKKCHSGAPARCSGKKHKTLFHPELSFLPYPTGEACKELSVCLLVFVTRSESKLPAIVEKPNSNFNLNTAQCLGLELCLHPSRRKTP